MAGVATGSAASGSADGPICQRGDNVHFYVQGGPRRRLDVHDPPLPMTRAGRKGAHTRLSDGVRAVGHAEREAPARRIADPLDAMVSRWLSV